MPHARIAELNAGAALELPGVVGVLTGADVAAMSLPFPAGIETGVPYLAAAHEVTRYVGEPLAVVVARDRYVAEDAVELIQVDYEPLEPVLDVDAAVEGEACVHDRSFAYGEVEDALAKADLVVRERFSFPRWSCTPVECYGVVCDWDEPTETLTAWANFQGPFTLHSVAAAALRLPGAKLRLITPRDSGGSFGIKSAVYAYVVLIGLAARRFGVPVRWTEDRLEHLAASSASTARVTELEAGFSADGELLALRYDAIEDVGAYVRAPEPATLYRMHGSLGGAYRVRNVAARNRVVLTNRCPTGLNRGFGGPQVYFALERTMAIAARRLGLDAADVARRNLVAEDDFPYRTPSGGLYDSGSYAACLERALELARYASSATSWRPRARPGGSSASALPASWSRRSRTWATSRSRRRPPSARERSRNPGTRKARRSPSIRSAASRSAWPRPPRARGTGRSPPRWSATCSECDPSDVDVVRRWTPRREPWTVASGNYSSRFSGVGTGAVLRAAQKIEMKLKAIAAAELGCEPEAVRLARARRGRATTRCRSGASQASRTGIPTGFRPGSSPGCTRRRSTRRRISIPRCGRPSRILRRARFPRRRGGGRDRP